MKKWGILTPYHEGDRIFSAPKAGLMPPEQTTTFSLENPPQVCWDRTLFYLFAIVDR